MLKKKFMEWALSALVTYLEENGADLAQQALDWVVQFVKNFDNDGTPQVVGSVAPPIPVGCEEFCKKAQDTYFELAA